MVEQHERYMRLALREAEKAVGWDEVPVGAVVVLNGKVIGRGHNLTRRKSDPTAHAEIVAMRMAAKNIGNDRIVGAELYCTLEPCAMCAGAMVHARIAGLIYGTEDPKAGACGSVLRVIPNRKLNHRPYVVKDVLATEAREILQSFFRERRRLKKQQRSFT